MHEHEHHHHAPVDGIGNDAVACPVLTDFVVSPADAKEAGLVGEYNGTQYFLCCNMCAALWDADPARYAIA